MLSVLPELSCRVLQANLVQEAKEAQRYAVLTDFHDELNIHLKCH